MNALVDSWGAWLKTSLMASDSDLPTSKYTNEQCYLLQLVERSMDELNRTFLYGLSKKCFNFPINVWKWVNLIINRATISEVPWFFVEGQLQFSPFQKASKYVKSESEVLRYLNIIQEQWQVWLHFLEKGIIEGTVDYAPRNAQVPNFGQLLIHIWLMRFRPWPVYRQLDNSIPKCNILLA